MQNGLLFVRSIGVHMITILAGCAATVILELFRRFVLKKEFPNRWYAWILFVFLGFAAFQAWDEQFTSAEGRGRLIAQMSADKGKEDAKAVGDSATIEALRQQVGSQQTTINGLVLQLGEAQSKEVQPRKIIPYSVGVVKNYDNPNLSQNQGTFILLSNKTITPVQILVSCESEIDVASGAVLGTATMMSGGWGGRVTRSLTQFGVGINSPAWTPSNPLLVTVYAKKNPGRCVFDEQ